MFLLNFFLTVVLLCISSTNFEVHARSSRPTTSKKTAPKNRVTCVTIPKCGTHLLLKCISLFGIRGLSHKYEHKEKTSAAYRERISRLNKNPPPYHYRGRYYIPKEGSLPKVILAQFKKEMTQRLFFTHWPYTKEFDHILQKETFANFIIIRDPRDMVVSFALMIHKSNNGKTADVNKIIMDLITGKEEYYVPWAVQIHEAYPLLWEKGLYKFYEMYLPWFKSKKFMLIKFENLVGQKGGGSYEKQFKTISKIAQHLGVKMTFEKIQTVIDNLFGGTWTFREGQIGGWKKYFTPEIKKAFKQDSRLTQLLIALDYEIDNNW